MNQNPMNPCPNCGNRHARMWRSLVTRKYHYECSQCHWASKRRYTRAGALRAWNRQKKVK